MLIIALVLAVISLAALVTAVVTSNELIAWACIGFSALGVLLLIVDAVRDRSRRPVQGATAGRALSPSETALAAETTDVMASVGDTYPDDIEGEGDAYGDREYTDEADEEADETVEDYPDEVVYDDPEHDEPSDDEPDYPIAAEEAAIHIISAEELVAQEDSDTGAELTIESSIERDIPWSDAVIASGDPSLTAPDEPSYMVTESPTVSYADNSADDSVIVIYSSDTEAGHSEESEERDGER